MAGAGSGVCRYHGVGILGGVRWGIPREGGGPGRLVSGHVVLGMMDCKVEDAEEGLLRQRKGWRIVEYE